MTSILGLRPRAARVNASRSAARIAAACLVGLACRGGKPATAHDGGPQSLRGDVDLAIGEAEGTEEYTFARIGGITVDAKGRILVADNGAHTIRVFSPEGKFQYAIGRHGQGPGELIEPCCLALRGDTLLVRDNGNSRYALFTIGDTTAVFQASARMAHHDANRWVPVAFDSAGDIMDVGNDPNGRITPGGTSVLTVFHVDRAGRVVSQQAIPAPPPDSTPVRKATSKIPGGMVTRYLYPPYPALAMRAYSPFGEQARAVSSRYSIGWFSSAGTLLRTVEGKAQPPALSTLETARAESSLVRDMKWLEPGTTKSPFSVPTHKQPLRGLYFDLDGRLWVEHSVPQGAPRKADVYDHTGKLAYTMEWPANVDLGSFGAIRENTAYGVLTDSLDVERVARLRFK